MRARRRMYDLPRFYRRARQGDIEGLVVNGRSWTVGDFLPVGFEAYVRLPNPFWKIVAKDTEGALVHQDEEWRRPRRHLGRSPSPASWLPRTTGCA